MLDHFLVVISDPGNPFLLARGKIGCRVASRTRSRTQSSTLQHVTTTLTGYTLFLIRMIIVLAYASACCAPHLLLSLVWNRLSSSPTTTHTPTNPSRRAIIGSSHLAVCVRFSIKEQASYSHYSTYTTRCLPVPAARFVSFVAFAKCNQSK